MNKIVRDTYELFEYEVHLTFDKMPKSLYGEEARVRYILLCLIKKAIERNKACTPDLIKLEVGVSDEDRIVLSQVEQRHKYLQKAQLMVRLVDCGEELTPTELKYTFDTSVLKRVATAMGGKLVSQSVKHQANFVLKVPCKH